MARAKKKKGDIDVCAESRKATVRNLNFLLVLYEYTIAISFSGKGVDIAFFKVIPKI